MNFVLKKIKINIKKFFTKERKVFFLSLLAIFGFLFATNFLNKDKTLYISHGDFKLPRTFDLYILKHFYIWSNQSGSLNLDGILRFIARIPSFISFFIFNNNLSASYSYIFLTIIFSFFSFYYFAKNTLKINDKWLKILFSTFFALNPAYLGYFAKIGLVLSSSAIPLILAVTDQMFRRENFSYLLIISFLLDISFIHPFTFFVNFGILLTYLSVKTFENKEIVWRNAKKIFIYIFISITSNAFILLPIFYVGTLDKGDLTSDISFSGTENLISISRAKNFLEAISWSKSSFVDFLYFNDGYKPIFYLSMIFLYILIGFGIYKNFSSVSKNKKFIIPLSIFFLISFFLSLGNGNFISEKLNIFLASLPVGWVFRSPLKWQLYLPFSMISIGILTLSNFKNFFYFYWSKVILLLIIFLSNFYVGFEVFQKLILPKSINEFSELTKFDLNGKKVVLVNNEFCKNFSRENRTNADTLTFLLSSGNNMFQSLSDQKLFGNKILYKTFDYVVTCRRDFSLLASNDFKENLISRKFGIYMYENINKQEDLFAVDSIYTVPDIDSSNNIYNFLKTYLNTNADIILKSQSDKVENVIETTKAYEIFSKISLKNIKKENEKILFPIYNKKSEEYSIYKSKDLTGVKYETYDNKNNKILKIIGYTPKIENNENVVFEEKNIWTKEFTISKTNNTFLQFDEESILYEIKNDSEDLGIINDFKNITILEKEDTDLIEDGSFENGIWESFCENKFIDTKLTQSEKIDGEYSLALETRKNPTCVGKEIDIEPSTSYILKINSKINPEQDSLVKIEYNNEKKKSYYEQKLKNIGEWTENEIKFNTPENFTKAKISIISRPVNSKNSSISYFDNLSIQKLTKKYEILNEKTEEVKNQEFEKNDIILSPYSSLSIKTGNYNFENLISNGSFENETWTPKVEDCFNYDKNPDISMSIENSDKSDGENSLKLEARRHIACTTKVIDLNESKNFLLSFDYKSPNAIFAGYSVTFDNPSNSYVSERLKIKNDEWNRYSKIIEVPSGSSKIRLKIYAYQTDKLSKNYVLYDNFYVIKLPILSNKVFLIEKNVEKYPTPKKIGLKIINPTKSEIKMKSASGKFFIVVNEDYSEFWKMYTDKKEKDFNFFENLQSFYPTKNYNFIPEKYHISLNIKLNTWYFNVDKFCSENKDGCKKNEDGTYDIVVKIEFWPQRYFYVGVITSLFVYLPLFIYFIFKTVLLTKEKTPIYLRKK